MSTPQAPADLVPSIPEDFKNHKNPALRLTATMLDMGFKDLRTMYSTITTYQKVKGQKEELLKDSTVDEVITYRQALEEQAKKDAEDKAAYEEQIKSYKDALNEKLEARKQRVNDEYYIPAMKALNLDAGVSEDDYTTASAEAKQLVQTLTPTLATLIKQAESSATEDQLKALKAITIPKITGSLSMSDAPNFTPKFARVTIIDNDGKREDLPSSKIKNTDVAKRVGVTRDQLLVALAAPFAGDTDIWRNADPGFVHTFDVEKNDTVYHLEVVKAARTKADTEEAAPSVTDDSAPVTGTDETPQDDAPVQF